MTKSKSSRVPSIETVGRVIGKFHKTHVMPEIEQLREEFKSHDPNEVFKSAAFEIVKSNLNAIAKYTENIRQRSVLISGRLPIELQSMFGKDSD